MYIEYVRDTIAVGRNSIMECLPENCMTKNEIEKTELKQTPIKAETM